MFRHLPVLRTYATRVIIHGEPLTAREDQDRTSRLREFLAVGSSLNWTEKEMTALLLREVFARLGEGQQV
jgi:hypothetical protein